METIRHKTPGYFSTPPGTCIIKPDLPFPDGTRLNVKNRHPFIVITDGPDYVECVMARTLWCDYEGKDLRHKLRYHENIEISNPHPPMESGETRGQYVNCLGTTIIPKRVLYTSTDLSFCCDGGTCLNMEDVQRLRTAAKQFSNERDAKQLDPYDYEELPYPIDEFLPNDKIKEIVTSINNTKDDYEVPMQ